MSVSAIFRLADGRTAFTGYVDTGPDFIEPGECELVRDGSTVQKLMIEGEMLVERRPDPVEASGGGELRSLSTLESVDVDAGDVARGNYSLRRVLLADSAAGAQQLTSGESLTG
jgi:hypothetical protein